MTQVQLVMIGVFPTLVLIIAWGIREWHLSYKDRHKKIDEKLQSQENKIANAIDNFTLRAIEMTTAITRLQVQIEHLAKVGEQMPKVIRDLDALHAKVREFTK